MHSLLQKYFLLTLAFIFVAQRNFAEDKKQLTESERNYILIETLNRIEGDIHSNAALKEAVYKALPKVRGTEAFVRIVRKFSLMDQDDGSREMAFRKMIVHALAQTQEGAAQLLNLAREEKLPENLKFAASTELNSVRWAKIKTEAAKILPLPQGKNTQPFPPVAELMKMK